MTRIAAPELDTVIGPYSPWPRRRFSTRKKAAAIAGTAAAAAFVHCVVIPAI